MLFILPSRTSIYVPPEHAFHHPRGPLALTIAKSS
jgi:hypothetical protein